MSIHGHGRSEGPRIRYQAPVAALVQRTGIPLSPRAAADVGTVAGVAAAVFVLAYLNGGHSLTVRGGVALLVWWAVVVGLVVGIWPLARVPAAAIAVGALLAAFAGLALLSASWGASTERALTEFNRTGAYLGVFTLAVVAASPARLAAWRTGLAVALVAVAAVALVSRFFPEAFGDRGLADSLPGARTRLGFPLGYWNGLAILAALGVPVLLSLATWGRSALARAAAVAPVPALATVIFLSSSRGGAATAVVGAATFVLGSGRRWGAAAALAVGVAASAAVIAVIDRMDELVDGPLDSAEAAAQGWRAALAVAAACVGAAVVHRLASALALQGRGVPRGLRLATAVAAVAAAVVVVAAADPVARFAEFREPPSAARTASDDFVRAHLASGNGSGRWQFWSAAVDEFRESPLGGGGAGSYEAWWAENGSLATFIRDAHSLYLETLGELGLAGALVLVAALGLGLAVAIRRVRGLSGSEREVAAGLLAAYVAFLVAAGVDWVWELTVIGAVGVIALGLLVGPSTLPGQRQARRRLGLGVAVIAAGCIAAVVQLTPLLAHLEIRESQAAAARGDGAAALESALAARRIAPWAASPRLQEGLVLEQAGQLDAAARAVRAAIRRDDRDWRSWLVLARIETKRGRIDSAGQSLDRAATLNPRSPLFARVGPIPAS